jgi:membrane-bound serine protease (ClpP class)
MIGQEGRSLSDITPQGGEVFLRGEHWRATSAVLIPTGATVRVLRVDSLVLHVEEVKSNEHG